MSGSLDSARVAVITGASSGIGAATARALAAAGYKVAVLARRADRIEALAAELGDGALAIQADVTDRDQLVAAAARVADELGGADVINISSVAGRTARPANGVYAATKWGMNGWSESLRQELLPDVRVTLIEPGVVDTEVPSHITDEATREAVQKGYDVATVQPEEIAEVIAFVLSRPRHLVINEVLLRPATQQG